MQGSWTETNLQIFEKQIMEIEIAKVRMLLQNLFQPIMALSVQSIHNIFMATLHDGRK